MKESCEVDGASQVISTLFFSPEMSVALRFWTVASAGAESAGRAEGCCAGVSSVRNLAPAV